MTTTDPDAAARVIERLLLDPGFRAEFRRDPVSACREAGLDDVADEMSYGAGKAMHTLDLRESKSSVAGVMMAAALEGVGVLELANLLPQFGGGGGPAVNDVLSRVNLPAVAHAQSSLGAPPGVEVAPIESAGAPAASNASATFQAVKPAPAGGSSPSPGGSGGGSTASPGGGGSDSTASPGGGSGPSTAGAGPAPNLGDTGGDGDRGGDSATASEASSSDANLGDTGGDGDRGDVSANGGTAGSGPNLGDTGGDGDRAPGSAAPQQVVASNDVSASSSSANEVSTGPATPIDPAQYGTEGTGGTPGPEALALLENKNLVFDEVGVADIKAGRIDPRVVAILGKMSEDHKITISCMCSDHAKLTTGGSVSNHHFGRGIDIAAVDGMPVNGDNTAAHEIATELAAYDESIRPSEIGSPWAIAGAAYFTDAGHQDHLHVAFDSVIDTSWKPPGGGEVQVDANQAGTPATAQAPAAQVVASAGTMSLRVPAQGAGKKATISMTAVQPAQQPVQDQFVSSGSANSAAGGDVVSSSSANAAGGGDPVAEALSGQSAGPKALAAVAEAKKYLGTAYLWGGSKPETGFDCSGLTQWAYAQQGIETGRTTYDQIDHPNGTKVGRDELRPGDLVFFRSPSGDVHHMGMSLGGDKFLHAPRTGDVVKISNLNESYYAQQFTGARRFDNAPAGSVVESSAADSNAVQAAQATLARDAVEAQRPGTMTFKAIAKQETAKHRATVQFLAAIKPEEVQKQDLRVGAAQVVEANTAGTAGDVLPYPGDDATPEQIAAWMASHAEKAGLPRELPVMASLVESGMKNLHYGDASSVGYFQMLTIYWDKGEYAGYQNKPELQIKWFIDHALEVKKSRMAAGYTDFLTDPSKWGEWVADTERPLESLRYKYQLRLEEAQKLVGGGSGSSSSS